MRTALCCVVVVVADLAGPASAEPDFTHATELYKSAGQEMAGGKYAEAARDYSAAFDITKDPVLFYKIGFANEKAGRCDVALIYYGRYLKEAKADPKYLGLVRERIAACGGDARVDAGMGLTPAKPEPQPPTQPARPPPAQPQVQPPPSPPKAQPLPQVLPPPAQPAQAQPLPRPPPPPPPQVQPAHRDGAWLLVGGSLALVTAGAVLAYSATSSQQDLKDLYVGLSGVPPAFDASTQKRYNDLIDEGKRYQYLSWSAFGLAGVCAIGATILFTRSSPDERVSIAPVITPQLAGAATSIRF